VERVADKKNVDRLTSAGFVQMWRDRIDTLYARYADAVRSRRKRSGALQARDRNQLGTI
jgi:hypothetical protein